MAKTGLNFGEKLQIVDKSYRVITDALKLDEVFGKLTFRSIEGAELIYEADRNSVMKTAPTSKFRLVKFVVSPLGFTQLTNTKHSSSLS